MTQTFSSTPPRLPALRGVPRQTHSPSTVVPRRKYINQWVEVFLIFDATINSDGNVAKDMNATNENGDDGDEDEDEDDNEGGDNNGAPPTTQASASGQVPAATATAVRAEVSQPPSNCPVRFLRQSPLERHS